MWGWGWWKLSVRETNDLWVINHCLYWSVPWWMDTSQSLSHRGLVFLLRKLFVFFLVFFFLSDHVCGRVKKVNKSYTSWKYMQQKRACFRVRWWVQHIEEVSCFSACVWWREFLNVLFSTFSRPLGGPP